jgi:hypothetical protein
VVAFRDVELLANAEVPIEITWCSNSSYACASKASKWLQREGDCSGPTSASNIERIVYVAIRVAGDRRLADLIRTLGPSRILQTVAGA